MRAHQIGDLGRPGRRVLDHPIAALEEIPAATRPHLVDQVEMIGEMRAAVKVEHDHRPLGRDEGVADRVVQAPDLHVGAVGGVADVDRIGDHDAGIVARASSARTPGEAMAAQRREVGQPQAERLPLGERERSRSEVTERAETRAAPRRPATIFDR